MPHELGMPRWKHKGAQQIAYALNLQGKLDLTVHSTYVKEKQRHETVQEEWWRLTRCATIPDVTTIMTKSPKV